MNTPFTILEVLTVNFAYYCFFKGKITTLALGYYTCIVFCIRRKIPCGQEILCI